MEKAKKIIKKEQVLKRYDFNKPEQVVKMATTLKTYIVKQKLFANIKGKNYVMVEGWQFAGGLLGYLPRIEEVKDLGGNKWLAKAVIINQKTQEVVSVGYALCSKAENKKKSFDEYAILSMAQTRAIGKAYRNLIGWIMKLAGYEATPREEIKARLQDIQEAVVIEETGKKVEELKGMLKGKTDKQKMADLKKRTGVVLMKGFEMTETHAGLLIADLLYKETK